MKEESYLHVAVGVIKDDDGNILISLRHDAAHQGGLWEFPGGKVEPGESVEQALTRELKEELDISVHELSPLIKIKHQYSDLNVLLDVWKVSHFLGKAIGCEGQQIKWVRPAQLTDYSFPKANIPIITAARLPTEYAILNAGKESDLLTDLKKLLAKDIKLIQARVKSLTATEAAHFIQLAMALCKAKGASLLINSEVENARELKVDGLHLTSTDLLTLQHRPTGYNWIAASCHNQQQLKHAEKIALDFVVLSPVLATKTHPESEPLGWGEFKSLAETVNIPVYALGGMQKRYCQKAQSLGAQGIAGITGFLEG